MSNLPVPSSIGGLTTLRAERQASRAIAEANAVGAVVAAQEMAKIEAVAQVTETALLATSHVSSVEALLIERTPHAEARLRHIADAGCAGMASIVLGVGRRF